MRFKKGEKLEPKWACCVYYTSLLYYVKWHYFFEKKLFVASGETELLQLIKDNRLSDS